MKRLNDGVAAFLKNAVMLSVFGCVVTVSLQIFFRYVLNSPLDWTEQLARYLFLYMNMLAIPIAYRAKSLIAFDLLTMRLPQKVQEAITAGGYLLIGAFGAFYFWQGVTLVIKAGAKMTAGSIKIPVRILYVAQPICAALLVLFSIELLIEAVMIWRGKTDKEVQK